LLHASLASAAVRAFDCLTSRSAGAGQRRMKQGRGVLTRGPPSAWGIGYWGSNKKPAADCSARPFHSSRWWDRAGDLPRRVKLFLRSLRE